jgi:hypothetical protein
MPEEYPREKEKMSVKSQGSIKFNVENAFHGVCNNPWNNRGVYSRDILNCFNKLYHFYSKESNPI